MRITLSTPDEVAERFRSAIPSRKRSCVVVRLIERELDQRDKTLAAACIAANQDESLRKEIDEWKSFGGTFEMQDRGCFQ